MESSPSRSLVDLDSETIAQNRNAYPSQTRSYTTLVPDTQNLTTTESITIKREPDISPVPSISILREPTQTNRSYPSSTPTFGGTLFKRLTPTMPPASTSGTTGSNRARRRSGQPGGNHAIADVDPIILRERERMEMERERARGNAAAAAMPVGTTNTPSGTTTTTTTPAHYLHQTLTATRPNSRGYPYPAGGTASSTIPQPTTPSMETRPSQSYPQHPASSSHHPYSSVHSSLPLQHHRLPTTSAAPIASSASNAGPTNPGGSNSQSNQPYPGGLPQPSVMALPPGSNNARGGGVDGPSGPGGAGGSGPPGSVLVPGGPPGQPSGPGHHGHPGGQGVYAGHDPVIGHDKMNVLLSEIRTEYETMRSDCITAQGRSDAFETQSEFKCFSCMKWY
jgi:hypothetical protein